MIVSQNQKIDDRKARFEYFPGALSRDILRYVNTTLEESEFDVAIIHVGINDLNCKDDMTKSTVSCKI